MKMKTNDFKALELAINKTIADNGGLDRLVAGYEAGQFPRNDSVQDLSKRFKWDLFWSSGIRLTDRSLQDERIYTALKKIVPVTLEVKY
jgi:hypothetical protein